MKTVKLKHVKPGMVFRYEDTLGFKTEYRNNDGRIQAYIIGSGETFCAGGVDINELDVIPIDIEKVHEGLRLMDAFMDMSTKDWSKTAETVTMYHMVHGWSPDELKKIHKKRGLADKFIKELKRYSKHVQRLRGNSKIK